MKKKKKEQMERISFNSEKSLAIYKEKSLCHAKGSLKNIKESEELQQNGAGVFGHVQFQFWINGCDKLCD